MKPFRILLALFLIVPLVEIYLLIQVGSIVGGLWTIFLVVFTAVLGALLLRMQGFATVERVRSTLARGEVPAIEMMEGAVLIFGGALLLTPGFFTDAIGFVCLVPRLRRMLILWGLRRGVVATGRGGSASPPQEGPKTIEGEYWRDDERR